MRILLVQSWLGRRQHPVLPLGLACLAGSLNDHSVLIADPNIHDEPMDYLRGILSEYQPNAVGLGLRNCDTTSYHDMYSYIPSFLAQVEMVRREKPEAYLIAGGAGFSLFSKEIMESCPEIDCGVTGHGETVSQELIMQRARGLFPGGGGSFCEPRLDLLDHQAYLPFQRNLSVGVEVHRGCGERCSYCSYACISGNRVLQRDTGSILEETAFHAASGVQHIFMVSPVFNSTRARAVEVVSALRSAGLPVTWEAYHTARDFDEGYACLAAESGCTGMSFSPDGGTREQMELMGKDYAPVDLEKAINAASKAGIELSINVFPWLGKTGAEGMFRAFRNGHEWGKLAGDKLRRLRFSLVRRMPGTMFAPASLALTPEEFHRPVRWALPAFLIMKRLMEKGTWQCTP